MVYRPHVRDLTTFENYLLDILSKNKARILFLAGDFNINLFGFESNLLFQFSMAPRTSKPTTGINLRQQQ